MKHTLIAHINIDIDGELPVDKAAEILQSYRLPGSLMSEEVDGSKDWAILVDGWRVEAGEGVPS